MKTMPFSKVSLNRRINTYKFSGAPVTVESTQRNGVAAGANNPLPSAVGTLRGSTLGGASLTGSFCNSMSMFGVQGGNGGHKKTSRPSLSRIILSLESNSAKQQALQHILNALQV